MSQSIKEYTKGASYHTRLKCRSFSSLCPHLNDIMHVWQETVQADFQQHHECSAHVLSHFWLLVCRQSKQVLQRVETGGQRGWIFASHQLQWVKHDGTSQKRGKLTGPHQIKICIYVYIFVPKDTWSQIKPNLGIKKVCNYFSITLCFNKGQNNKLRGKMSTGFQSCSM